MEFQEKLKRLRADAHMTQQQLADAVFVSRTLVTKWESGVRSPSAESVKLLCELFSVSEAELLCLSQQSEDFSLPGASVSATLAPAPRGVRAPRRGIRVSRVYAAICNALKASLFVLLIGNFFYKYVYAAPRSGINALYVCASYGVPIGVMATWELFLLRRLTSIRLREIYSLLCLLLTWIGCMAFYAFVL